MNDRIIEMAIAAGFNPVNCTGSNVPLFEKFAELIIAECILTIQLKMPRDGSTPENVRSREHVQDIKEHFGVE